jgi:hypothetical protein
MSHYGPSQALGIIVCLVFCLLSICHRPRKDASWLRGFSLGHSKFAFGGITDRASWSLCETDCPSVKWDGCLPDQNLRLSAVEATESGATADDARQVRALTADKAAGREACHFASAPLRVAIIHLALAWIDSRARCGPTEKFDVMNLVYPCHESQAKNKIRRKW